MKRPAALAALLFLLLALPAHAQRRDALSETEVDQLREVADQGNKKIELYLKFIRARLFAIEQMQGDPRMAIGRGKQIHNLLEDFTNLVDELDDNIDTYANRKEDIRKALKLAIEANAEFQLKLRTIKANAEKLPREEASQYDFPLENAQESLNGNADNARTTLDEVEQRIAREKAEEKERGKKKQ